MQSLPMLYKKYILPKFLNWAMKDEGLKKHRKDVVFGLSGVGLEIGFGSGLNLPYYKSVVKLFALEPSQELFREAKQNIRAVSFPVEHLIDSAEKIPLAEGSVDFVVSTWTLCTIPQPEMALKEVFRVLKPGGKFAFVEHGKAPGALTHRVQNILTPVSKCVAGGCHLNRDVEGLIRSAGFEIQTLKMWAEKSKPLAFMYEGVAVARK